MSGCPSRATHKFQKQFCVTNCCSKLNAFEARDLDVDTRVNIIKKKTRSACCFSTPDLCSFYGAGDCSDMSVTPTADFATDPDHPSAVIIPPAELSKGAVFKIKTFSVTNTQNGNRIVHIDENSEFDVSVSHDGLLPLLPNVLTDDTPKETLNGSFIFGSFDLVLDEIFKTFRTSGTDNTHVNDLGTGGFLSLTNPNELEFGTPHVVQIIWPEHLDWEFSFIAHNNKQYTYSSKSGCDGLGSGCGVTETDLNVEPNTTIQLETFQCSGAWAVPCDPLGYMTQRQPFDLSSQGDDGPTGCSGGLGGIMCIDSIQVERVNIRLPKDCLCAPFEDDFFRLENPHLSNFAGMTGNEFELAKILNKAFNSNKQLRGWKAEPDVEYGFLRITYPDNVLYFTIKLIKMFVDDEGNPLPQCMEIQNYKQGALTEFIKPDENQVPVTTTNNSCIMSGICWTAETDMNGCFLLE